MTTTLQASSTIVVDASLAVWTVLPVIAGENTVELFANWWQQNKRLIAPALWMAETVSAIRQIVYSQAISFEEGQTAIDDLFSLGVEVIPLDAPLCQSAFKWAERLGQSKAYDSFYLALAERLGAECWTADKRLVNGARQVGVSWVHWIGEQEKS